MKEKPTPDLPPILPDIQNLLTEYLICPERLPIHEYERNQEFWPRQPDVTELFHVDNVACGTTLKVQRDPNTGKITEFREVPVAEVGLNAKNSMSLNRAPASFTDGVRGDPTHFPFWPGGFPDPVMQIPEQEAIDSTELLTVPPGFSKGLCFEDDGFTVVSDAVEITTKPKKVEISNEADGTVNLMTLVQQEQDFLGLWKENTNENVSNKSSPRDKPNLEIDESEVLPIEPEIPVLNISKDNSAKTKNNDTEWAVMVDIKQPVSNFHERIPELAHEYPFELDTFQKQAILKLEENCDVFVAAHTSAGKTVVAEYAIALSQKHKTRTIYTSPIKALSNQKYRDFKKTFEDVGLITGDFQINQTGVCLIMTTEILRSMLYCGSEVIRDLEYVIFDEVHYINDPERGHVWEEVLILLPAHVRIVLLSATVPNTMEFAHWLGMTKRRKVYVISTLFRPVPLQHYLYTGSGGKSKDERFLILEANGNFLLKGHKDALEAKESRKKKGPQKFLPTKDRLKQEGTALMGLIDHLRRNDLLPVVAFTFSRALCDRMADSLKSMDLTTGVEKHRIHAFYEDCIKRLKDTDKQLPQIITMRETLKNGIGVHHSGILPMIKEIVEMLFQNGCVKVLFATETFAMGVNMPARTVVFNSIVKWDGIDKRFLKPAEYIQMAGRAGRRGLDTTGTVLIRCADEVPDVRILKEMMLGKPQKLESQFRLTYSMLLSLFRAESCSVESMMSHSFYEVRHVSKADELKVERDRTQAELSAETSTELSEHIQHLFRFYKAAAEFILIWKEIQPKLMKQPQVIKEMTPGRVLLISHGTHLKKLAILLNVKKDNQSYKVLVQCNQSKENDTSIDPKHPEDWYRMLSFTYEQIFQPEGSGGHEVLDISAVDIVEISTKVIKMDCDLIIKDWEKRQIARFRDDPPGQTCQQAIQELAKLTNNVLSGSVVEYLNPAKDYRINDINLCNELDYLNRSKSALMAQISCTKIANFEQQFLMVFKRKYLEEKLEYLNYMISSRSLALYPDYLSRIEVLKELGYVDKENKVQMKGRVACGMGMNELLITELIFRNTLTNLQAAEVAALLSALVFQVKANKEKQNFDDLPETLSKGMKQIEDIYQQIKSVESMHQVTNIQEELNFGLVEVVYEWAREKPFAEIMMLTDVQEGIIVRCIQQLNETLKDVKDAALIIGEPVLKAKMEEASNAIKRDIVFAASLYTQREAINFA